MLIDKLQKQKMCGGQGFSRKISRDLQAKLLSGALFSALLLLSACSINATDKDKNGEAHVDIKSPVGDLHVSEEADIRDAGLTLYPGSKPAPKDDGEDKKSANVNLSVPGFSLKVIAAEFTSNDAPDKVIAYYNNELQKYGKPIECHGDWTGGHVDSSRGKDDLSKPVSCKDSRSGNSIELKVGTEGNQHLVAVTSISGGTRFALAYVRMHTGSDSTI
jgi:hypothetical protein